MRQVGYKNRKERGGRMKRRLRGREDRRGEEKGRKSGSIYCSYTYVLCRISKKCYVFSYLHCFLALVHRLNNFSYISI
jgi:hypothetical protein